jgi:glycosyltransferase involved in cell wall biosynthesis
MAISPKILFFAVTNDLNYDQRMIRICTSLQENGFDVHLVGRKKFKSQPLSPQSFKQHRLNCIFSKGPLFYLEYNIRLFFFLILRRADGLIAIDLDTILPVLYVSKLKRIPRIYDAHELFCEMKEVVERKWIHRIWLRIERIAVPSFNWGYTVNRFLSDYFQNHYKKDFPVVRNMAVYQPPHEWPNRESFILYQGAVNEGRCFEILIPAMKFVNSRLVICGAGNFLLQAKLLVQRHGLENKIEFKGELSPIELRSLTRKARIGITLFEHQSKNNYYSLANRFFDYVQAGTPQLAMNYPAYAEMNQIHQVAVLLDDANHDTVSVALNQLLEDDAWWNQHHLACLNAAPIWCWQHESTHLTRIYKNIFG